MLAKVRLSARDEVGDRLGDETRKETLMVLLSKILSECKVSPGELSDYIISV